jgi:hypothetical protein
MDNQHQKIKGYRDLTQAEIDLMNEIKAKSVEFAELVKKVRDHIAKQRANAGGLDSEAWQQELLRLGAAEPERWAALGRTSIQEGCMFLTRAVAQPTFD